MDSSYSRSSAAPIQDSRFTCFRETTQKKHSLHCFRMLFETGTAHNHSWSTEPDSINQDRQIEHTIGSVASTACFSTSSAVPHTGGVAGDRAIEHKESATIVELLLGCNKLILKL